MPCLLCQPNDFSIVLGTEENEYLGAMIEDYEDNYVLCGTIWRPFCYYEYVKAFVYKIGPLGDTLDYKVFFNDADSATGFYSINLLPDSTYFLTGFKGSQFEEIWVLNINKNLEIIHDTSYFAPETYNFEDVKTILTPSGNIIAGGISECIDLPYPRRWFLYEFSKDGNIIKHQFSNPLEHVPNLGNVQYNAHSNRIIMFFDNYNTNASGEMLKFKPNFTLDTAINLPLFSTINYSSSWIDENRMIISEQFLHYPSNPQDNDVGLHIMDTNGVYLSTLYMGEEDIVDYPAWVKGIDTVKEGIFYVGGTNRQSFSFYPVTDSYIMLGIVDTSLNMLWYQKFGGDAYYQLYSIEATNDGGCIMAGCRYDYQTQDEEKDIFIKKVYPPDSIFSKVPARNQHENEVELFPNPGGDIITITSKCYNIKKFELYNMNGIKVIDLRTLGNKKKILTNGLPTGLYLYRIIDEKNNQLKGKWIKR